MASDRRAVDILDDHYEVVAHLADGAYATVHRGIDLWSGRDVVLTFPLRQTRADPAIDRSGNPIL